MGRRVAAAILTLPLLMLIGRCPARQWKAPYIAPTAALAVLLALYMIDNLSNAMFNPIYYLAAGALLGPRPLDRGPTSGVVPDSTGPGEEIESAWQHAEILEAEALSGGGDWAEVASAWDRVVGDARDRGSRSADRGGQPHTGDSASPWCASDDGEKRSRREGAPWNYSPNRPLVIPWTWRRRWRFRWKWMRWRDLCPLPRTLRLAIRPCWSRAAASAAVRRSRPRVLPWHAPDAAFLEAAGDRVPAAVSAIGRSIALDRSGGSRSDHLFLAIAYAHLGDRDAARDFAPGAEFRPLACRAQGHFRVGRTAGSGSSSALRRARGIRPGPADDVCPSTWPAPPVTHSRMSACGDPIPGKYVRKASARKRVVRHAVGPSHAMADRSWSSARLTPAS